MPNNVFFVSAGCCCSSLQLTEYYYYCSSAILLRRSAVSRVLNKPSSKPSYPSPPRCMLPSFFRPWRVPGARRRTTQKRGQEGHCCRQRPICPTVRYISCFSCFFPPFLLVFPDFPDFFPYKTEECYDTRSKRYELFFVLCLIS